MPSNIKITRSRYAFQTLPYLNDEIIKHQNKDEYKQLTNSLYPFTNRS